MFVCLTVIFTCPERSYNHIYSTRLDCNMYVVSQTHSALRPERHPAGLHPAVGDGLRGGLAPAQIP